MSEEIEQEVEEPNVEESKEKKLSKLIRKGILAGVGTLTLMLFMGYLLVSKYYEEHFYVKTFINDMDLSNMTLEEAQEVIVQDAHGYSLTIKERDGAIHTITGEEIGLEYEYDEEIDTLLEQQDAYAWMGSIFSENKVENPYHVVYDMEKLETFLATLGCYDENKKQSPTDATISEYEEESGFILIEETQGNEVDDRLLRQVIEEAITRMNTEISLEELNVYKQPVVTKEDEALQQALETITTYMSTEITYRFGTETEVIDGTIIGPALIIGEDYSVTIDDEVLAAHMKELDRTYSTYGRSWNFKTSSGSTITVNGGDYGWMMNESEEVLAVIASIEIGEVVEREPVSTEYSMSFARREIGDTYVEISKTDQHVYFYKNGKLVVDGSIVTGSVSEGYDTPKGVFALKYKQRDRTLRGNNRDGTTYASFVNYWMPFNGGIGMHDASWRSSFGGSRYLNNGSHGCINMPISVAKTIYEEIEAGTPVIVH